MSQVASAGCTLHSHLSHSPSMQPKFPVFVSVMQLPQQGTPTYLKYQAFIMLSFAATTPVCEEAAINRPIESKRTIPGHVLS